MLHHFTFSMWIYDTQYELGMEIEQKWKKCMYIKMNYAKRLKLCSFRRYKSRSADNWHANHSNNNNSSNNNNNNNRSIRKQTQLNFGLHSSYLLGPHHIETN